MAVAAEEAADSLRCFVPVLRIDCLGPGGGEGHRTAVSYRHIFLPALLGAWLVLCSPLLQAQERTWQKASMPVPADEERIEKILKRMDLRDKVGQTIMAEIHSVAPAEVKRYRLGGILNGGGSFPNRKKQSRASDWLALADKFHAASIDRKDGRPAIPVLWGTDAVHGHNNVLGATLFPHNIGLGAAGNENLVRAVGIVTAREVSATGIRWTFAPTVTVPQDDRWGRTYEGYSESPGAVAVLGAAMVEGLQGRPGQNFMGAATVIATAKHFIGDGGTHEGKDQGDTRVSEVWLSRIHGASYHSALAAGAQTVMASFNSWNGKKLHGHHYLLTEVLKGKMGFDGFVVGDWNGHEQLPGCTKGNCPQVLNAGVDMVMVPEDWKELYQNTLKQVQSGRISRERLDDAVRRILRVKMRAGLLDGGAPSSRKLAGDSSLIGHPDHRTLAREAVRQSLVLLKNNGEVLPIDPKKKILVVGEAAKKISRQTGGWSLTWQGNDNVNADFPGATSVYEGLRAQVEAAGGSIAFSRDGRYKIKPDVAIMVYGERPYAEFQGDLKDLYFRSEKDKPLAWAKVLRAKKIPIVSVFLSGRPLYMNAEINASEAFVAAWLPGTEGGGIADLLLRTKDGKIQHDFRGRLSFSWPKGPGQAHLNVHDRPYDPLFRLGYGLDYTKKTAVPVLEEKKPRKDSDIGKILLEGWAKSPYSVVVQEGGQSPLPMDAQQVSTQKGRVRVAIIDNRVQEDALAVDFSEGGSGVNAWMLNRENTSNWEAEARKKAVLSLELRVRKADRSKPLYLAMVCGSGCRGSLALEETLRKFAPNTWETVGIDFPCLAKLGVNFAKVSAPAVLLSEGSWSLDIGRIRIDGNKKAKTMVPCPAK